MRKINLPGLLLAACLACAVVAVAQAATPPAFPGAVGQGASATGGRGGDVYHVTTLEDYDPDKDEPKIEGSFRHALRSATGPRTIVFDVSGAIALKATLEIRKPDLTIAGQTSPGGITIWGYPTEIGATHNVIVRYLRFRTGDFHARGNAKSAGPHDLDAGSANALNIGNGERIIVDHVSASWGMDELLSVTRARDVTVQNCLIAQSLDDSFHPKGPHGFGSLIRGMLTAEDQQAGVGGFTFFGNLWAHNSSRNPSVGGEQSLRSGQSEADRRRADVNIVNNVIYDWGKLATYRSEMGDVRINLIANVYICGPEKKADYFFKEGTAGHTLLYQRGNWADLDQDRQDDGRIVSTPEQIEQAFEGFGEGDKLISDGAPFNFIGDVARHATSAEDAYARVLASAGASLWRDAIDRGVAESVKARTGKIIDSQEELRNESGKVPGIDDLAVVKRPKDFDVDRDGIADDFERSHQLNASDPKDAQASTLSREGYTNLEVYLNQLAPGRDSPER